MSNTPRLTTERLILRRFSLEDLPSFYQIMSDAEVNLFLPLFPVETELEARNYLKKNYLDRYQYPIGFHYAICLKADNIPIGYVNVADNDSHDFGYGLCKEFWHKGIVTEACKAIIEQLRLAGIPYITATHDVNNPRSGSVMQKLGMYYCYSYQEQWQPKNILVTFRMYQLNFDEQKDRVYMKYWDIYPEHFIENGL